jgi:chemotaxis response regulator CheB
MPKEAIARGAVDEVLPLGQIPAAMAKRAGASPLKERTG